MKQSGMTYRSAWGSVGLVVLLALTLAPMTTAQVSSPPDPLRFNSPDAAANFQAVSIEQRLDEQVDLSLTFVDETGAEVKLGDFLGERPAVLALVYYECPMMCTLILNGMGTAFSAVDYEIGEDFDVITVSIDPGETPELAAKKKKLHIEDLGRPSAEAGWHFLTGEEAAIKQLADSVGYGYEYDPATDQYAHAAGIMVLTPEGKLSRYYYGTEYIARDIEFGLIEASKGKVGSLVQKIVLLCFAYDPATGVYGFYVIGAMRVAAVLTMLVMMLFLLFQMNAARSGVAISVLGAVFIAITQTDPVRLYGIALVLAVGAAWLWLLKRKSAKHPGGSDEPPRVLPGADSGVARQ